MTDELSFYKLALISFGTFTMYTEYIGSLMSVLIDGVNQSRTGNKQGFSNQADHFPSFFRMINEESRSFVVIHY